MSKKIIIRIKKIKKILKMRRRLWWGVREILSWGIIGILKMKILMFGLCLSCMHRLYIIWKNNRYF